MPLRKHGLNVLNPANWGVEKINAQHRASSPRYVVTTLVIAIVVVVVAVVIDAIH